MRKRLSGGGGRIVTERASRPDEPVAGPVDIPIACMSAKPLWQAVLVPDQFNVTLLDRKKKTLQPTPFDRSPAETSGLFLKEVERLVELMQRKG